jgi:hypothetical protein
LELLTARKAGFIAGFAAQASILRVLRFAGDRADALIFDGQIAR